ncbi:MAG: MFS transporter, partial [Chloroflexota bacterium]
LHDQWTIFLMGILQGSGFMLYRVAQSPYIMAVSDEQNRTMLFSINFSLMIFGSMLGNLVAGQLPGMAGQFLNIPANSAAAYQLVIISGIALGATSLIPIFFLKKSKLQKKDFAQSTLSPILSIKQLFSQKIIFQLFLINIMVGLGAALLIPYLNVFFRQRYSMSDQLLGILYSLSSLLVIVGSISAPYIARLLKSKIVTTVLTQGLSLIFLLVLGFTSVLWVAEISFLLRTVLMQLSAPLLENFAMEVSPPGKQSTISSIRGIGWQIGQAAGLFISGLVQTRYGFTPLFITTAILYFIAVLLTWFNFRSKEKELSPAYG